MAAQCEIWVATEMRAGGAYARSTLALFVFEEEETKRKGPQEG